MSPNQLIPSQPYTLSYYITDHTDAATYYVQAVVYDATTGAVLDTQNLTRQSTNTHLFSKIAQAPGDSSGRGRRIVVVATAYDDSGYTSKSTNYQQQSENYIVVKPGAGVTLGGGYGIDYGMIGEFFTTEIAKILKNFDSTWGGMTKVIKAVAERLDKIPTENVNVKSELEPILVSLEKLASLVSKIPTEKTNVSGIQKITEQALASIHKLMEKDPPEEGTDLTPISDAVAELKDTVKNNHAEQTKIIGAHMSDLHTALEKSVGEHIGKHLGKAKFNLNMPFAMGVENGTQPEKKKAEEKPLPDISKLM